MQRPPRILLVPVLVAACVVWCGCSSTKMKLSGTPGANFSGHYRAGNASFDLSSTVPLVIQVRKGKLEACEFRKAGAQNTLALEIRQGQRQILSATAEPGAMGLRAKDEGGWSFEVIRPP